MASDAQPLGTRVRLAYGVGLSAEGIKNNAFNLFLLFYYQQVAGLDPVWCGVALFLALCVDAVVDPFVGAWSDGVTSRLGRRHPFMYASALPLALSFWAVFNPPAGLAQGALFAWLLCFAIGTRVSMSLFAIPHQALVAELSHDYDERTRLQSTRTVFAWLFGLLNALLAYTLFLRATATSPYDPNGFTAFATWGAIAMAVTIVISSLGTERVAVARQPRNLQRVAWRELWPQIRIAFQSPSYRVLVLAAVVGSVAFGLGESMSNYMNLFFWGFTAEQLAAFIFVIMVASLLALQAAPRLALRHGKHRVAIASAAITTAVTPALVALRVLDVLPASGSGALLTLLCVTTFVGYAAVIVGMIMLGAMIADVTDEHELRTGLRQEGLLYSASSLVSQAASGLGPLAAGLVLQLSGFSEAGTTQAPGPIRDMGLWLAAGGIALGIASIWIYSRYRLTRQAHAVIVAELAGRHAAHAASDAHRFEDAASAASGATGGYAPQEVMP